jgi:hypothetical protein
MMEFLGDVGHMKPHFGSFGDNVNVDTRWVHGLHETNHRLRNHFGHTRWNCYMTWVMCNLILVYL